MTAIDSKDDVKSKYAAMAKLAKTEKVSCSAFDEDFAAQVKDLYSPECLARIPNVAINGSLGSGNPVERANLQTGEIVLDLGSGAGLDALIAARHVGPAGKVIGLDLTEEMVDLARDSQKSCELANAEFIKGDIENIPLSDDCVDVIVSNCVINLCENKGKALSEAFRVLRSDGRMVISDIITENGLPEPFRTEMLNWIGCIRGALTRAEYEMLLRSLGFIEIEIEPIRYYNAERAATFLESKGIQEETCPQDKVYSAYISCRKI